MTRTVMYTLGVRLDPVEHPEASAGGQFQLTVHCGLFAPELLDALNEAIQEKLPDSPRYQCLRSVARRPIEEDSNFFLIQVGFEDGEVLRASGPAALIIELLSHYRIPVGLMGEDFEWDREAGDFNFDLLARLHASEKGSPIERPA